MRLIDADALIQQMADNFRQGVWDGCSCGEYRIAEDTILEAPTIDAVPVVRCKDCKDASVREHEVFCGLIAAYLGLNDFCSYGERKEK